MEDINSYFLRNIAKAEKQGTDLRADCLTKGGCCSDIRRWFKGQYYTIVRDKDLKVTKDLFERWVNTLMAENFPILGFKRNDIIPKDNNLFENKQTQVVKQATHFMNPIHKEIIHGLAQSIGGKKEVYIRGTDRGENLYYWTGANMKKGVITKVNESNGLIHIKIVEHELDLLIGDVHEVEIQAFNDYDSNIPLISEKELGAKPKEEKKSNYYGAYLVTVDSTKLSSNELLATHSLLRHSWATKYQGFVEMFYTMKEAVPEATFFELLLMVHIKGNYTGYYGIYEPGNKGGFMPTSKIMKALKINSQGNINVSVHADPKMRDLHANACKYIKEKNYRKGYETMLIASYGSKNKEVRTVVAISDHGHLTKDSEYNIIDESYNAYKVTADDFAFRWYQKKRFNKVKVLVDCEDMKSEHPCKEKVVEAEIPRDRVTPEGMVQPQPPPSYATYTYSYGSSTTSADGSAPIR